MLGSTYGCVYPGTGTGAFGTCSTFTVSNGSAMTSMALGDLNNDGHLDVVAGGAAGSNLNAWLGTGDGKFATHSAYPTISSAVTSLALGDLNGDGKLDVVMASASQALVYLGDGAGGLTYSASYNGAAGLEQVQIADMNRDGFSDVLLVSSEYNSLIVMLGAGDGTLAEATPDRVRRLDRPAPSIVVRREEPELRRLASRAPSGEFGPRHRPERLPACPPTTRRPRWEGGHRAARRSGSPDAGPGRPGRSSPNEPGRVRARLRR